ncbi:MAG: chitobiase/beta-hexosaminidase C-terminal domain-containing protein, partial [Muribaculaceae bacterium]|nr:chitobiase/beta-hexosaminidase C-terminal domain-containing protein [Muribaculaceae bacterium]
TAEQDVIFTAGLPSGNVRVTGITVTYQTPGEGLVVAKPEIVASETDNSVTINCATEGASIYYTLDGEEPTEEAGTKYEEPVTLTEACTVKAIAVMEGVSSSVASLDVYLRIVESLEQFLANASPETVKIECAVTAIETIGDYLMVKDDKGSYAIIHTLNNELKEDLNVENGYTWDGMTADFESYGTYGFIQPVSLGEGEQKEAVTPKEVSVTEFECVPFEYVKVQGLAVEKNYRYLTFTDINGNELDGYQFFLAVEIPTPEEATRYDVTGFASNEGDELWPASFVVNVNSGVNTVESDDSEGVYFNMQGIKIDNPNDKGVYIVVKNGKAQKRVVK